MENVDQRDLEGTKKEGTNLQSTQKLLDDAHAGQGKEITSPVQNLVAFARAGVEAGAKAGAEAGAKAAQNIAGGGDTRAGIIPPYMLEDLAKRNPNVPGFQDTLKLQPRFWPFPSKPKDEKGAREVYDAQGKETQPGKKARFEGQKATGNDEVDKAYDFTGEVRGFYKDVYNRNSIDGKGMKFVSTVNYGTNYENAFWNGSQMTYGRPSDDSPFKTFMLLDVCGHEITHGVTEKESQLQYHGQSGALNESLSDIFGELIQQHSKNQKAADADWVVGDGIWKDGIKGRGLRDMLNPGTAYDDPKVGKDPQPAHMKDYLKTTRDNGGVHYNSGIPNKAFATFAVAVGGNAWEEPGHIWYAARAAAGSNPSFAQFAYHTIEQAKKLGFTNDVPKLEKAWADVGVKPSATATDTDTPVVGKPSQKKVDENPDSTRKKPAA
ncbi:MAG: M4 family metallopeptidase [Candidatus Obscuribacterales bacterium]|nr:M4 family metallopeptidase [Candidatus Obscuribacterales bacterium]